MALVRVGLKYIGQTSRDIITRFKEHCRYIKSNNPKSAHALHVLNNQHEYGPAHNTVNLPNNVIKICLHSGKTLDYNILYDLPKYAQ